MLLGRGQGSTRVFNKVNALRSDASEEGLNLVHRSGERWVSEVGSTRSTLRVVMPAVRDSTWSRCASMNDLDKCLGEGDTGVPPGQILLRKVFPVGVLRGSTEVATRL